MAPATPKRKRTRRDEWWRRLTASFRVLPDTVIIGGQKCGSTSLFHHLVQHPAVLGPVTGQKEVHFFDRPWLSTTWYRQRFPSRSRVQALARETGTTPRILEATPYYLAHPTAAARMRRTLPDARPIAILRDPVERAFSQYKASRRGGYEPMATFEEALDAEHDRVAAAERMLMEDETARSKEHQQFSYMLRGDYATQLERWFSAFGREGVLVLFLAELRSSPEQLSRQLESFLDLPHHEATAFPRERSAPSKQDALAMSEGTRARLREHFAPHNARLSELLGRSLPWD
ncbi:MAG: sulfotransferase domain-containing protein [Planctomycetota bacterium]